MPPAAYNRKAVPNFRSCPECGASIEEDSNFCPYCGYRLDPITDAEDDPEDALHEVSLGYLASEAWRSLQRPSPIRETPSSTVFTRRPTTPMSKFIVLGGLMTVAGLTVSYGGDWLTYFGYTVSGFAAPLLYLAWMLRNDRYEEEPLPLVALTFGWGAFCAIFAGLLNSLIFYPLLGAPGAALVEEPLKLLGVYWITSHRVFGSELNDHLDGMIYGTAAGAGFAGLENIYYIGGMIMEGGVPPFIAIVIRSATAFNHIVWTAMAGRSVGLAKVLRGYNVPSDLLAGLTVAVTFHFLWNLAPVELSLFVLLPLNLLLLLRQVRTAQEDEVRWGFLTSAPVE